MNVDGSGGLEREPRSVLRVFAGLCLLSLASYVGFSEAVVAFLARADVLLTKLLELSA